MRYLLVLIVIGAALCWWWTTTPQYSMLQLKEAIKQHDLQKCQKYLDMDTASRRMVDDFLAKPMRQALGPSTVGQVIVSGLMSFVRPELAKGIKFEMTNFVETGSFRGETEEPKPAPSGVSLAFADDHLGFRKHALKDIASTKVDGDIANLELVFHNAKFNTDLPLDVKMRKMSGYWQVIELTNFPQFCGKLAKLEGNSEINGQPDTDTAATKSGI
jgi:hypothetical protein